MESYVDHETFAADVLERQGYGVLFVLDQTMECVRGCGSCVGRVAAVRYESQRGIAFVRVDLFACQRLWRRERGVRLESYA